MVVFVWAEAEAEAGVVCRRPQVTAKASANRHRRRSACRGGALGAAMECEALRLVRDEMGLTNVKVMIPFVRTLTEAEGVIDLLAQHGLRRGENDLHVVMMCEVPSNAVNADAFLDHFDGFSIGSNDLTQLTLGLDRDSALVADGFDERDPAVKTMLSMAIEACRARGKYVGICGQGPSDHPDLADWLMDQGIESMSLNPDTVVETWLRLAKLEQRALSCLTKRRSGPSHERTEEGGACLLGCLWTAPADGCASRTECDRGASFPTADAPNRMSTVPPRSS